MQIIIINRQKKIPISKRAIRTIVLKTLKILSRRGRHFGKWLEGVFTVVYVDNRAIQELNSRFSGKRRPTDVLCFDLSFKKRLAADIVISTEKAYENSRLFKTSPAGEANIYLVHGILHLLGFKDKRAKDRIRMQKKTLQILKSI